MKRKERKKISKNIPIIIILILILTILIFLLYSPTIVEKIEINRLKQESTYMINKINKEDTTAINMNNYIKENITTKARRKVEVSLEKYLKNIIENTNTIIKINKDKTITNALEINQIEKENIKKQIDYLIEQKEKLNQSKKQLEEIINSKTKYIEKNTTNKEAIKLFKELTSKPINTKTYITKTNTLINIIDIENEALEYLEQTKDFWDKEESIIFKKRNKLNQYLNIIEKLKDNQSVNITIAELVEDKTAPQIEAANITITEGTSINLKEKIKCIDEIDDEVECKISGEYDTNKQGEYTIKIETIDQSNNSATKTITLKVNEKNIYKTPYYIEVIRNQNTVIIYGLDNNKEYTNIIKVMPCSVGRSGHETPTGTFKTTKGYEWGALYGGVFGQYSTRIVSDILFHSVPYYSPNKGDLEWEEYNKLGSVASLGCVRMTVQDVKWIFDNCISGTTVKIYDGPLPNGITKPSAPKIDGTNPNKGWDPTDPDPNNPWNK